MPLNLYARIPKGLMVVVVGRGDGLCLHATWQSSGWQSNTTVLPSGLDSPLVLYLCNPTLCEWEWAERKAFAILVLLLAMWNSRSSKPNVPSDGGNVNLLISIFQVISNTADVIWEGISENCFLPVFQNVWCMAASRSLCNYKPWCDKILRKVPGYNEQNVMAACSPCLHISLVLWMESY